MITWILIICLMASLLAMLWFFVSANDRKRDFHWIRDKQEKLSQEYKELQWKHESLIHALKDSQTRGTRGIFHSLRETGKYYQHKDLLARMGYTNRKIFGRNTPDNIRHEEIPGS